MNDFPTWEQTFPADTQVPPARIPSNEPLIADAPQQTNPQDIPTWETTVSPDDTTLKEQLAGVAEAGVRGLISRPGLDLVEKSLGFDLQKAKQREESIGMLAPIAETVGLAAPAVLTLGESLAAKAGLTAAAQAAGKAATLGEFTYGGLLGKAGAAVAEKLGTKGTASKLAADLFVQNAIFQAADETSKAIEGNPNTINQALWNVGLAGAIGAGFGGTLGKASDLWVSKYGPKYNEFVKDFIGRSKDIANGNIPAVEAVVPELEKILSSSQDLAGTLSGATGLKRQDIQKLLPKEVTAEMRLAGEEVLNGVKELQIMKEAKPANFGGVKTNQVVEHAQDLASILNNPASTPYEIFVGIDNFKQQIGNLKDWNVDIDKPVAEFIAKIYGKTAKSLENEAIWGVAGKRQAEINKAVTEYLNSISGFKSAVMSKGVGGHQVINPDKVNTLINQVKKGKGALKQDLFTEFLNKTDELYNALEKIDSKLGVASEFERPSMTAARGVTQKLTSGMKAADFLHGQAINAASEAAGVGLGYKLFKGLLGDHEVIGALFGHYAIKPVLQKVLPVIMQPMMKEGASAASVKSASQAINAIINGENLSKMAAEAVFHDDKRVPEGANLSSEQLRKLDSVVKNYGQDPTSLLSQNEHLQGLLPNHSGALVASSINAVNYLNSQRPGIKKNELFDREIPVSAAQQAAYNRTLELAQNPLLIAKRMKDGTLKSKDVVDFQSMYPELYEDLKNKISSACAVKIAKKEPIPYRTRKSVSLYLQMPLDTNFKPQSIQAAQATYQPQQQPQAQLPQMAKKSSRVSKLPSLTETDQQRRMLNK